MTCPQYGTGVLQCSNYFGPPTPNKQSPQHLWGLMRATRLSAAVCCRKRLLWPKCCGSATANFSPDTYDTRVKVDTYVCSVLVPNTYVFMHTWYRRTGISLFLLSTKKSGDSILTPWQTVVTLPHGMPRLTPIVSDNRACTLDSALFASLLA